MSCARSERSAASSAQASLGNVTSADAAVAPPIALPSGICYPGEMSSLVHQPSTIAGLKG